MQKDIDFNPDRVQLFTDMALCSAAEAKGSALNDDEVEAILVFRLIHLHPAGRLARAFRARRCLEIIL